MNKEKVRIFRIVCMSTILFVMFGVMLMFDPSYAIRDVTSSVVVDSFSLTDRHGNIVSTTNDAIFGETYSLSFTFNLALPGGTLLQNGDSFRLRLPQNEDMTNWQASTSEWSSFYGSGSDVPIGQYRLHLGYVEVELNDAVNDMGSVSATLTTGLVIRHSVQIGVTQGVNFGGLTKQVTFRQRTLVPAPNHNDHTAAASTNHTIRWLTTIGSRANIALARDNELIPMNNVFFEKPLTGEFEALNITLVLMPPMDLVSSHPANTGASSSAVNHLFERIEQLPGETYDEFKERLLPIQYGLFKDTFGRETVIVSLGDIGNNGLRIAEIYPNFINRAITAAINTGIYSENDREALSEFFERVYGLSSITNGNHLLYRIHVTERFPVVSENTRIPSNITITMNGVEEHRSANGTLQASTGVGTIQPASARLYLHEEDTTNPLEGVPFALQIQDTSGEFVQYPNVEIMNTNEDGMFSIDRLRTGVYRFIQLDEYNEEFPLSLAEGFDSSLNTVVSEQFRVSLDTTEGHIIHVTNARLLEEEQEDSILSDDQEYINDQYDRRNIPDTLASIPLFVYGIGIVLITVGTIIISKAKKEKELEII